MKTLAALMLLAAVAGAQDAAAPGKLVLPKPEPIDELVKKIDWEKAFTPKNEPGEDAYVRPSFGRSHTRESFDVPAYSRGRFELGAGVGKYTIRDGRQKTHRSWDGHAYMRIDLSRNPKRGPRELTMRHTEIETSSIRPARVEIKDHPLSLPGLPPLVVPGSR